MAYIGASPNSAAFLTDQFSGNGSTTAFTLSTAPAGTTSLLVSVSGVLQDPTTYSVVGTTLTLGGAAPTGTGNISVRYLGIPASGVTTTAYRTLTEFTATASQTTFTPPSYTVGFIAVYQNGVMLGSADYTATNGTTVVLAVGALVGDLVTTESFYVSSVLNALPVTGGTISGNLVVTGTETVGTIISPAALTLQTNNGTTAITVDTSQNVGIGTSSPGIVTTAGRTYLTIIGTSAAGALELATNTADADTARLGLLQFTDKNSTAASKIVAVVASALEGATVNNRGSRLEFYTKADNGAGATEQMRIDSAGLLKFNSGYGSVATAYGCRAWVNFNGSGTVAIRASGNVSSITDNGTGDYTVNFTTAMPDANYNIVLTGARQSGSYNSITCINNTNSVYTTSAIRITVIQTNDALVDIPNICASIFR